MHETEELQCSYTDCGEDIRVVVGKGMEGKAVECPHCSQRSRLQKVRLPSVGGPNGHMGGDAEVWELVPE
jgi:DNA-directed RNA polymerase subunit RPC12/RpoP